MTINDHQVQKVHLMRYALPILLLSALLPRAFAQDKEAEQLFRGMEKKIKQAKACQITFEITREAAKPAAAIGGAEDDFKEKKRTLHGTLLLTKDNKARLKASGDPDGRFELISDGERVKTTIGLKRDWKTPKGLNDLFRTMVSRAGLWFSLIAVPHLLPEPESDPDKLFHAWGFKAAADDKVGGRNAKVISYRLGRQYDPPKSGADDEEFTIWLDSETLLPLKRVWIPKRQGLRITEIYQKVELDPKVDAKAFNLPSTKASKFPNRRHQDLLPRHLQLDTHPDRRSER